MADSVLNEFVDWARNESGDAFAPNSAIDIFTVIRPFLATPAGKDGSGAQIYTWDSLLHRKAAMLEAMRVHAMFESSGNWNEGVDRTNAASMANIKGQESGLFQVSFDSEFLGSNAMAAFAHKHGIDTPATFIAAMKVDHILALQYYARLMRISFRWAGPFLRHGEDSVYPWLRRAAMAEFQRFLS